MSSLHRGYCTFAVPHVEGLVLKFFEISVDPFDSEKIYIVLDKSLRKAVNFVSKNLYKSWGERVAQWWEHLLPTNVARTRTSASTPYVGWVCCWFSPLLEEIFLRVLRFLPSPQKPTLPNSYSIYNARTRFNEFSGTPECSVGKQITLHYNPTYDFLPNFLRVKSEN